VPCSNPAPPLAQVGDKIQYIKIVEGAENLKNANY
jgi:hypothetical protein